MTNCKQNQLKTWQKEKDEVESLLLYQVQWRWHGRVELQSYSGRLNFSSNLNSAFCSLGLKQTGSSLLASAAQRGGQYKEDSIGQRDQDRWLGECGVLSEV